MSEDTIQTISITQARRVESGFRPTNKGETIEAAPAAQIDDDQTQYAKGLAEGQDIAAATFAVERAHYQNLLSAAEALQPESSEELAQLIADAVYRIVSQIIENAPIESDWLLSQAKIAADTIAECDAARTMRFHPDDLALMDTSAFPIPLMADPALARGTIRIDCSSGWIEHGRSVYLDALRDALSAEATA